MLSPKVIAYEQFQFQMSRTTGASRAKFFIYCKYFAAPRSKKCASQNFCNAIGFVNRMPKKSIFVIGGVPEIGEVLAESVIKNVLEVLEMSDVSFVLTGSHSHREFSRDRTDSGWGTTIKKFELEVMSTISLPTYWTMDQKFETPYVFTKKG